MREADGTGLNIIISSGLILKCKAWVQIFHEVSTVTYPSFFPFRGNKAYFFLTYSSEKGYIGVSRC